MQNLYLILRKDSNPNSYNMLLDSARQRNINVKSIFTEDFDYTENLILGTDDGIYNLCDDPKSCLIEKFLLNKNVASLYSSVNVGLVKKGDSDDISNVLIFEKNGISTIPTILSLTTDILLLKKYSDYLGGFPIVLKSPNASHGLGVMRVDSFESLLSICNFLIENNLTDIVLKKYIPHKKQARVVVLGDKAISSHFNLATSDFRTNFGPNENRQRDVADVGDEIKNLAITAIKALEYEFGGVDILVHRETEKLYIAEVNFPCAFAMSQKITGVDISGAMIDHLIAKSTLAKS